MKISRILATKPTKIITIGAEPEIRSAVDMLAEYRIGALLVVNAAGKLIRILSERDIVRRAAQDEDVFSHTVRDVMKAQRDAYRGEIDTLEMQIMAGED